MRVVRQARLELSGGYTPNQLRPPPPHRAPGSQDGVRGGDRGSTQGKAKGREGGAGVGHTSGTQD